MQRMRLYMCKKTKPIPGYSYYNYYCYYCHYYSDYYYQITSTPTVCSAQSRLSFLILILILILILMLFTEYRMFSVVSLV